MYKLEISSTARNDLAESVLWHNEQQEGLSKAFLQDLFSSVDYISNNLSLFPIRFSGKFRFSKLTRFPFLIVYEVIDDLVVLTPFFIPAKTLQDFKSGR